MMTNCNRSLIAVAPSYWGRHGNRSRRHRTSAVLSLRKEPSNLARRPLTCRSADKIRKCRTLRRLSDAIPIFREVTASTKRLKFRPKAAGWHYSSIEATRCFVFGIGHYGNWVRWGLDVANLFAAERASVGAALLCTPLPTSVPK